MEPIFKLNRNLCLNCIIFCPFSAMFSLLFNLEITSHGVPDISAVVHGLKRTILLLGMGKNFQSSHTERLHKLLFTASLFGAQHKKNSVENKREILLAVPLDKTLNGMSPPLRRRQEVGPSSLSVVVAQSN